MDRTIQGVVAVTAGAALLLGVVALATDQMAAIGNLAATLSGDRRPAWIRAIPPGASATCMHVALAAEGADNMVAQHMPQADAQRFVHMDTDPLMPMRGEIVAEVYGGRSSSSIFLDCLDWVKAHQAERARSTPAD